MNKVEPSPPGTAGPQLAFIDCSYTVTITKDNKPTTPLTRALCKGSNKPKRLLNNVTAEVRAGSVLAILGPSGAGKTTLLNMLTLEPKGGEPVGHLRLNGKPCNFTTYNQYCAYVQQFDALWPMLSARDHLKVAFELFQPSLNGTARAAAIDSLLDKVGLTDHQHTRAGNQFIRGLSGGLKRRLSIALALAKQPQVLFLDEPTTGIDSASAAKMMTFLKQIALDANIAVVCTIHQPSAPVWAGFDDCLILASGRVAYFGKAATIGGHFSGLGRPLPAACNPAEFILDLVNKDFTSESSVTAILDAWERKASSKPAFSSVALPLPPPRASYPRQVFILLKRQLLLLVKDPSLYAARCFMNSLMVTVFSIVYLEARNRVQTQAQQRCFFFVFCIGIPSQLAIGVVILSNMGLKSIAREVKDGMYHPLCQWLAASIVQAPMMFALGASAMWPAFWGAQLPAAAFPTTIALFAGLLWTFEGVAEMFSLVKNPMNGMLFFLFFFIFAFLFCGMFVAFDDVIVALRWICYVTPFGYSMRSMLYAIMSESEDYAGAAYCTPDETLNAGTANETVCSPRGFYCPDDPYFISCFGVKGTDILDSVGVNFPVISGHDVFMGTDLIKVIAIGLVARLCFVTGLLRVSFSFKAVTPPSGEVPGANVSAASSSDLESGPGRAIAVVPQAQMPASDTDLRPADDDKPGGASLPIAANANASNHGAPVIERPETEFTFVGVRYTIPGKPCPKTAPKEILQSISAKVPAGDVLAIVGPSGAGKTILLNTLTLEKGPGFSGGTVAINGHAINQRNYSQLCAYVPRDDILWPTLTARQHLEVAARLFRPTLSFAQQAKVVDELLMATGMESCQHTKAGDALRQGLSGGQRRRLSLALALVKRPRVVVLDEPTSGLDSAAAAAIMRLLKRMACSMGASAICTIHQPSAAVYDGFDQCLVLSLGRTAYCGKAADLKPFFESIGKPPSASANPAEFVLDEVSPEMSSHESVTAVLDAWAARAPKVETPSKSHIELPPAGAGLCLQTWILFKRTLTLAISNPVLYLSRMVLIVILILCFGLIYIESRTADQDQVMPRLFLLNWVCTMPSILNLITVLALNTEYTNARAEMKNGMYSPIAYIIATTLVQVPMMGVLGLCALIPGFAVGNWPWEGFGYLLIIYAANMWCFETMAQLFSLGSNAIFGMFNYIQVWSMALLFNGVVFRGQDVVGLLRWMYFGFPLKWFMNALCYTIFTPSVYSGISLCNYTSNMVDYQASVTSMVTQASTDLGVAVAGGDTATAATISGYLAAFQAAPTSYTLPSPYEPIPLVFTSVDDPQITLDLSGYTTVMKDSLGCFRGFYCPNASDPLQCFGATGEKILSTLNANYESITPTDERLLDVMVLLVLAIAFKCMYVIFVLADIYTKAQVREFLNLNSPGLVVVSCLIVCLVALAVTGTDYGPFPWL